MLNTEIFFFEVKGYQCRLMRAGDDSSIQVNIFNPTDAGHSFAFFVRPASNSVTLAEIADELLSSEVLSLSVEKAKLRFSEV